MVDSSSKKLFICPNCSAEFPEHIKFCSDCGTKIEDIYTQPNLNPQRKNKNRDSIKESSKDIMNDVENVLDKANKKLNKGIKKLTASDVKDLEYLEKLAELKEKGLITEEEFDKKKKEILKI